MVTDVWCEMALGLASDASLALVWVAALDLELDAVSAAEWNEASGVSLIQEWVEVLDLESVVSMALVSVVASDLESGAASALELVVSSATEWDEASGSHRLTHNRMVLLPRAAKGSTIVPESDLQGPSSTVVRTLDCHRGTAPPKWSWVELACLLRNTSHKQARNPVEFG